MNFQIPAYTFDASERTITFTDVTTLLKRKVSVIFNVTDGICIYDFSKPTAANLGGTVATNVLTLAYNTTTMSDTDELAIYYREDDYLVIAGAVLNNNTSNLLIPSTDLLQYTSFSFHLLTIGSGTPVFLLEGSNDGSTWQSVSTQGLASTAGGVSTFSVANTLFGGPIVTRYLRIRVSVAGSGGSNATAVFVARNAPVQTSPVSTVSANQSGAWSVSVSAITPGTGATGLGKAEDAAAANGDTGIFELGVRRDTLADRTSADGDYSERSVTRHGAQLTKDYEKHAKTYMASAQINWNSGSPTDVLTIYGSGLVIFTLQRLKFPECKPLLD